MKNWLYMLQIMHICTVYDLDIKFKFVLIVWHNIHHKSASFLKNAVK